MMIEADVPPVMWVCFSLAIVASAITLYVAYRGKKKKSGLFCFIGQGVFTICCFLHLMDAFTMTPPPAMQTEEISWSVGLAGLCWGVSIVFMLRGIWLLSLQNKTEDNLQA